MSVVTERADVVERFLKEPAMQDTLEQLRRDAYTEFLRAVDADQLRAAHALAKAVDRLETSLQAVVDAGARERMDEQRAERSLATR